MWTRFEIFFSREFSLSSICSDSEPPNTKEEGIEQKKRKTKIFFIIVLPPKKLFNFTNSKKLTRKCKLKRERFSEFKEGGAG